MIDVNWNPLKAPYTAVHYHNKYKPSTELTLALLSTHVHRSHPNNISLKTKINTANVFRQNSLSSP